MTNTKQNAIILKTAVGISEPYGLPYLPLPASPAVTSFHLVHDADFDAILWLCRCNFDKNYVLILVCDVSDMQDEIWGLLSCLVGSSITYFSQ